MNTTESIYTAEDTVLCDMVNHHAAECRRARNADARLTRFWGLLTWGLYLAAFLVLIWGVHMAACAALIAPVVGKLVTGVLIALCVRCLYKLAVLWGGER